MFLFYRNYSPVSFFTATAFLIALMQWIAGCSTGGSPVDTPLTAHSANVPALAQATGDTGNGSYAPDELLVVLKDPVPSSQALKWAADSGLIPLEVIRTDWGTLYRLKIVTGEKVTDAAARLNADPRVEYAEPNFAVEFFDAPYVPNDPMWERDDPGDDPRDSVFDQWGPAKAGAPIAWNENKGSPDVIVAVLDTGMRYDHEDLADIVWHNEDEIPDNKKDDDANGWVDDWIGWNFDDNNNNPFDTDWTTYYHGTACSGIVAAAQDNNKGVSGMAPGVKVMAVKLYLGWWQQSFVSSVVNGLNYASKNGADIVSMSFGTPNYSNSMANACASAYNNGNGMVLFASAGNSDANEVYYPAGYDNSVIAVAAVCAFNSNNQRMAEQRISKSIGFSWGSTYGNQLDISGYGDKYTTTYGEHYDSSWDGTDDFFFGGTSCACPMTAGVAALLKSFFPSQNASWVRARICETADDLHGVGWDNQSGYGRVNAVRAIYGSDRYENLQDGLGAVPVSLPSARYHDCIHDVPSNPYYDPRDLYKITTTDAHLSISLYIYNWGENLDMALYSDPALVNAVAESKTVNTPFSNTESIELNLSGGRTYYLAVYSPSTGNSSLYDLQVSSTPLFDIIGTDLAPAVLSGGGVKVPFLKLECTAFSTATLDSLVLSKSGTLGLSHMTKVRIYDDTVPNGVLDDGDTLIKSAGPFSTNRIAMRQLGIVVTSSNPRTLFVTADILAPPAPATLSLGLESYKDASTLEGYETPCTSMPIRSGLCLVQ